MEVWDYEGLVRPWKTACFAHAQGKVKRCPLVDRPSLDEWVVQRSVGAERVLVEHASVIDEFVRNAVYTTPCKAKEERCIQTEESGAQAAQAWIEVVVRQFSAAPAIDGYVIRNTEEWQAAVRLLMSCLSACRSPDLFDAGFWTMLADLVGRPQPNYWNDTEAATQLLRLITILKCPDEQAALIVKGLVALTSAEGSNPVKVRQAWLADTQLTPHIQFRILICHYKLLEQRTPNKSANMLETMKLTENRAVLLNLLRQAVLDGHAASISAPGVLSFLNGCLSADPDTAYNAALLISQLFPRSIGKTLDLVGQHLTTPEDFLPFILTGFGLHDVENIVLAPLNGALGGRLEVAASPRVLNTVMAKGADMPYGELTQICALLHEALQQRKPLTMAWVAVVLAMLARRGHAIPNEDVVKLGELLADHKDQVTSYMADLWVAACGASLNQHSRGTEVTMPVDGATKTHIKLEVPLKEHRKRLKTCIKSLKHVSPSLKMLKARVKNQPVLTKRKLATLITPNRVRQRVASVINEDSGLSLEQVVIKLNKASTALARTKDTSELHLLIHRLGETARQSIGATYQELHETEQLDECILRLRSNLGGALDCCCRVLEALGTVCFAGQLPVGQTECSIVETVSKLVGATSKAPVVGGVNNVVNHKWFVGVLCAVSPQLNYLMFAMSRLYARRSMALQSRVGLAQCLGKLLNYLPRQLRHCRLPIEPVKWGVEAIHRAHKRVLQLLDQCNETEAELTPQEQHEMHEYVRLAICGE